MSMRDDALIKSGCFNTYYEKVSAGIFGTIPFFDKKDMVQVKYEMIRAASNGEGSITEVASAFGLSRKSYYQASAAFDAGGLCALVPKKTGPKAAHKLTADVREFIGIYLSGHKNAKPKEISAAIESEMGIKIHPRTIHRHLKKN